MSEHAGTIIIITAVVVLAIIFACWFIDRGVQAELDEFDEYIRDNPETRFRKVNGDDVG